MLLQYVMAFHAACAVYGGSFIDNPEVHNGCGKFVPADFYIPGCPRDPWTILDDLLRLIGRLGSSRLPAKA